jgi:hypothetical protein
MNPTLTATAICPMPAPLIAAPDDGGDTAYFALASKLGVRNAFIVRRELENAIREENIHVYDRKAVDAWMESLVKSENERLRKEWGETATPEDIAKLVAEESRTRSRWDLSAIFDGSERPKKVYWGWRAVRDEDIYPGTGDLLSALYPHAIPFAALATMEKILAHVSDASFAISDYEVELPDPFLMVTHKLLGTDGLVVERWSEPSFRG